MRSWIVVSLVVFVLVLSLAQLQGCTGGAVSSSTDDNNDDNDDAHHHHHAHHAHHAHDDNNDDAHVHHGHHHHHHHASQQRVASQPDSHYVVDYEDAPAAPGYVSNVSQASMGAIAGVVLVILCIGALVWNERNAVANYSCIAEAKRSVQAVSSDVRPDALDNGRLVHFCGPLQSTVKRITDPWLRVDVDGAAKVKREVQMYQWQETVKEAGRGPPDANGKQAVRREVTYAPVWSDKPIAHSTFRIPEGHVNPQFPIESTVMNAPSLSVGQRILSPTLTAQLRCNTPVPVSDQTLDAIHEAVLNRLPGLREGWQAHGQPRLAHEKGGWIYICPDADVLRVGDLRVRYFMQPLEEVSIVAMQRGHHLEPWVSSSGKRVDTIRVGSHSAQQILKEELSSAATLAWICRVIGFLVLWLALSMVVSPLSALLSFLPPLASLVSGALALGTFVVALILASVVISIAWLFYRPSVAIPLLVVVAGVILYSYWGRLPESGPASAPSVDASTDHSVNIS